MRKFANDGGHHSVEASLIRMFPLTLTGVKLSLVFEQLIADFIDQSVRALPNRDSRWDEPGFVGPEGRPILYARENGEIY